MKAYGQTGLLNVYGRFVVSRLSVTHSSPPLQHKRQHCNPTLYQRSLPGRRFTLSEIGGCSCGNSVELLSQ